MPGLTPCATYLRRPSTAGGHLQWRAGHVPGLTRRGYRRPWQHAPMEGRARARPDSQEVPWGTLLQWRAGHVPGLTATARRCAHPSMEGRARARPDSTTVTGRMGDPPA